MTAIKTQQENNELRVKRLVKLLPTQNLVEFTRTCEVVLLQFCLDELETRMNETDFIKLCDTL